MSTHCWSVVAPRSGRDAPWTPAAHPRAQRCLLSPLLGQPQPRHAAPETDSPPLPPCCPVLRSFRLVRGQDLGQGTWPRAAFLVCGVLVTQSKCLSLDTRAALCRALGCEPCSVGTGQGPAALPFTGNAEAHHDILYTSRKTIGSDIGKLLRYYTSLGCDCEAVCIKMLRRIITWKTLPVKC